MSKKIVPFIGNIEKLTLDNKDYRRVLHTDLKQQLVVMSLLPKQDIGMEVHRHTTQFIRIEKGTALVEMIHGNLSYVDTLKDGDAVVIPQGFHHNITNVEPKKHLKLYTIYSPPEHKPGTIQKKKPKHHKD